MRILILICQIFTVSLCLWLTGCASGKGALQRGDYYRACEEAVNRLRSNPNHKDATNVLSSAYPLAQKTLIKDVEKITVYNNIFDYERVIGACDQMNKLADDIIHCPAALAIVPHPKEYYDEKRQVINVAVAILYGYGMKALEAGSVEQARSALNYFQQVKRYSPDYEDVDNKLEQSRYEATLRVIISRPLLPPNYQISANFFYDKLMNEITNTPFLHLVRFYTPEEATKNRMTSPHQILELHFEDFIVGNSRETSNTIELKRDSVVLGTVDGVNRRKQNVYGTVKAKYTMFHMEIISGGILGIRIINPDNGRVLSHKDFAGKYVWISEWASYNGDERALNPDQLALSDKHRLLPPPPQDLFAAFADPLYEQVFRYIKSIY